MFIVAACGALAVTAVLALEPVFNLLGYSLLLSAALAAFAGMTLGCLRNRFRGQYTASLLRIQCLASAVLFALMGLFAAESIVLLEHQSIAGAAPALLFSLSCLCIGAFGYFCAQIVANSGINRGKSNCALWMFATAGTCWLFSKHVVLPSLGVSSLFFLGSLIFSFAAFLPLRLAASKPSTAARALIPAGLAAAAAACITISAVLDRAAGDHASFNANSKVNLRIAAHLAALTAQSNSGRTAVLTDNCAPVIDAFVATAALREPECVAPQFVRAFSGFDAFIVPGANEFQSVEYYRLLAGRLPKGGVFIQIQNLMQVSDTTLAATLETLRRTFSELRLMYAGDVLFALASNQAFSEQTVERLYVRSKKNRFTEDIKALGYRGVESLLALETWLPNSVFAGSDLFSLRRAAQRASSPLSLCINSRCAGLRWLKSWAAPVNKPLAESASDI